MQKSKIIIPNNVKRQIDYLHSTYPDKEWSGILIYTISQGNFYNLNDFVCEVRGIYPMDLGKASYTEFEYNKAIVEVYDIFESEELPIEAIETGMIHSHHNMKAYFSGTDMDELKTNARKHNYYLSLVVNVDEEYAAKIAFPSKVAIKETHSILNKQGQFIEIPKERNSESLLAIDLDIEIQESVSLDTWFKERISELKKVPASPGFYGKYATGGYGYGNNYSAPRDWRTSKQIPLFPETKKEEIVEDKEEEFLIELVSILAGKQYHTITGAVRSLATAQYVKGLFDNFDETFIKTYIKYYKGKPSNPDEIESLVTELLIILEAEEVPDGMRGIQEDSCLDMLKILLYEQIPQ